MTGEHGYELVIRWRQRMDFRPLVTRFPGASWTEMQTEANRLRQYNYTVRIRKYKENMTTDGKDPHHL